ncbi:MAG: sporulation protein YabP [Eubacterium sp.]|nr:sporulation protein YabP [Eubacterium sp.]MBR4241302.1 sporulation protein YabP [Eubacterium sp.]MBR7060515.1 sporulation protein YabP [Eubacterium sp.]
MAELFDSRNHSVYISNREVVELTGISDVSSFNEEEVNASCESGNVLIKGSHLLVETLDLENGILKVNGRVTAIVYSEKSNAKNFFGRIFS